VIDEGEGPAVLLLHGEEATSDVWRDLGMLLAARFRVIAPDGDPGEVLRELGDARLAVIGERHGVATALQIGRRAEAVVLIAPTAAPGDAAVLDAPVLIFAGEDDPVAPGVAEALNDAIPTSTLGLLPGVGHDVIGEAAFTIFPMVYEYLRARYLLEPHGHETEGVVRIQLERRPPWIGDDGDPDGDEEDA
jgi:pimeloyl-ACP methyl ester carboxylesterase